MSSSPAPPPRLSVPDARRLPLGWNYWLPVRGQEKDKLCVHLALSLRERLDRARVALRRYPELAALFDSRNALIAYACYRLRVDLDARGPTGTGPEATVAALNPAATSGGPGPQPPGSAGLPHWAVAAPLYRVPWEHDFAETRCQLILRFPPRFVVAVRELHAEVIAAPRHTRRPGLAAVQTISDLVGLACHELCVVIEADTPAAGRR